MTSIDFYFGPGSRYSYLAAVRIPALEKKTSATIRWRAVYSPDLIKRAGSDPFAPSDRRGQYDPTYRTRDAQRWAELLGVPYVEPDFGSFDSKRLALWSVAAASLGRSAAFGMTVLTAVFGRGVPPKSPLDLAILAQEAGLSADKLASLIESGAAAEAHEQNIKDALA
ncbi:MAG TPA: DsbA family protein, partial [Dongiaceae bacterium]|nr:DsbA family protein [Dongiaceae bacterium]